MDGEVQEWRVDHETLQGFLDNMGAAHLQPFVERKQPELEFQ